MRSRTADILITSEVLYQLSYGGSLEDSIYSVSTFSCPTIFTDFSSSLEEPQGNLIAVPPEAGEECASELFRKAAPFERRRVPEYGGVI